VTAARGGGTGRDETQTHLTQQASTIVRPARVVQLRRVRWKICCRCALTGSRGGSFEGLEEDGGQRVDGRVELETSLAADAPPARRARGPPASATRGAPSDEPVTGSQQQHDPGTANGRPAGHSAQVIGALSVVSQTLPVQQAETLISQTGCALCERPSFASSSLARMTRSHAPADAPPPSLPSPRSLQSRQPFYFGVMDIARGTKALSEEVYSDSAPSSSASPEPPAAAAARLRLTRPARAPPKGEVRAKSMCSASRTKRRSASRT
jgi:hypothetical protein